MKFTASITSGIPVGTALSDAVRFLGGAGATPRLDAEVLLMHVSGLNRAGLIARDRLVLPEKAFDEFQRLLQRRKQGEPVAYLTGTREFWSMDLNVTPAVLIPRPETELLVEKALVRIPENAQWLIADLGTGSGAIALALAKERPKCRVVATDISSVALEVARSNVKKLGLENIELRQWDWCTPLAMETFDMIVSNPPYVRADDPHLETGDVRHEPVTALVSGADGLDAIRHIASRARELLKSGAWLLLEHGWNQASLIQEFLKNNGWRRISCYQDLNCHDRVIESNAG